MTPVITETLPPLETPSTGPVADPCGPNQIYCGPYGWTGVFNVAYTDPVDCGGGAGCQLRVDVYVPSRKGDSPEQPADGWPLVVAIPGGPLAPGIREGLAQLAAGLAVQGAVVVAADWREARQYGGGYPSSFEDVACAIRFSRSIAGKYEADPSRVVLVSHSYGGFPGAVVSLSPKAIEPTSACLGEDLSPRPDAYVGLAAVSTLDEIEPGFLVDFFGSTREADPATWASSDPVSLAEAKSKDGPPVRLVLGSDDAVVTADKIAPFVDALRKANRDVDVATLQGAGHADVLVRPEAIQIILAMAGR